MIKVLALATLAACTFGETRVRPLPVLQAVEREHEPSYLEHLTALRTTLGRAGIVLEMRGVATVIMTSDCTDEQCTKCELAAEGDELFPRTLEAVTRAFALYPTKVLEASAIQHVTLCRQIEHIGSDHTRPAGTAILQDHRLLISFEHFTGTTRHDESTGHTLEEVVHHELFHLLDWETSSSIFENDPEWSALNPDGFTYGGEEKPDLTGFVNQYAQTNVVEDRAATFQFLMAHSDATCLRASEDPIIDEKVRLIASRLAKTLDLAFLLKRAPCVTTSDAPLRRRYARDAKTREAAEVQEGSLDTDVKSRGLMDGFRRDNNRPRARPTTSDR